MTHLSKVSNYGSKLTRFEDSDSLFVSLLEAKGIDAMVMSCVYVCVCVCMCMCVHLLVNTISQER